MAPRERVPIDAPDARLRTGRGHAACRGYPSGADQAAEPDIVEHGRDGSRRDDQGKRYHHCSHTDVGTSFVTHLTVRNVDQEIARALKIRSAANGRSAEAEHRMILRETLGASASEVDDFAAAAARLRERLRLDGDVTDIVHATRDADRHAAGQHGWSAWAPRDKTGPCFLPG